jgi:adenylate cyclase
VGTDFEAEGLLEGLDADARGARRELLARLEDDGVPLSELRDAVEQDRLALLPVERVLEGEGKRYTAEEVAKESGIDVETLRRQRAALGLPVPGEDERGYTEGDVEAAKRLRLLLDAGLPDDGILEATRVIGLAMSQIAAANNALVGEAMLRPGDTELEAAERYVGAAKALLPLIAPTMEYALGLHFREALRIAAVGSAELAAGRLPGSQQLTACFADLVDFTRLGEELPPEELGGVTGRLAALAGEVATGPVRLVKMIGDAAMLVSPETDALVDASLALVESAEAEGTEFPLLRAGVASGPALARAGDWYGRPVNLASRITAIARPGSVLASEEVAEALDDRFSCSDAGERRLKGISDRVRLYRVRRADDGGSNGDAGRGRRGKRSGRQ